MPPTKSDLSFSDETNHDNVLNTNSKANSKPPALTPPIVIPVGDRISDQDPVRRSYSVSLHSINRSSAWRNAAWQTHAVVNAGAAALGSWLLTLRGGIFHQDAANPHEMVVQALGWLSVESRQGAPSEAIVSHEADADTGVVTRWHTLDALRSILSKRGLPQNEIEKWVHACTPALTADIRADAVWVNRSDCFDAVRERWRQMRRGGMPHQGADSAEKRISLVEGWLNVESREHVPAQYIAAEAEKGGAVAALRAVLVKKGLTAGEMDIWLKDCGPALHALEARLLPGQVLANHSDWFEDLFSQQLAAAKTKDPDVDADTLRASLLSEEMGPEDIWDVLGRFFKDEKTYFLMDGLAGGETETGKPSRSRRAKRAKPEASAEQTFIAAARSLLSERYGRGKGRDNSRLRGAYDQIRAWAQDATPGGSGEKAIAQIAERTAQYGVEGNNLQALLAALNDSGPSAVKPLLKELAETPSISVEQLERLRKATEKRVFKLDKKLAQIPKGARPLTAMMLADLEAQTGMEFYPEGKVALADELAVMFDFAARRVSMNHTNIKKREAERFELVEKANRVDELPPAARSFLDSYCRERSIATLSVYGYRIRPRAIAGWQEILKSWQTNNCNTAEARKVEVRKLQDRGKSKFDPALMEALAEEEALSVWVRDGSLAPDILKTYVAASEAKEKFKEMKVPAFRHPDPYYHPCFCDFGTGRWKIAFSIMQPPEKRRHNADPLGVSIAFRDGEGVAINHDLKFRGKRFEDDLGIDPKSHERPEVVEEAKTASRLSRFGRSAAGSKGPLSVSGIWEKATWGARLEAPRQQLADLGRIAENTTLSAEHREELLAKQLEHINWHLSISPELQPVGAYPEYAREHGLVPNPKVYPHADVNSERGQLAQLRLSRLPGLRVLSVDLGVSYSAACTVLEAVTRERLLELCKNAGINSPDADSLEIRVPREGGGQSLFRRIGPDILPDGTVHPAPWALVERQFRIKLDGEKGDIRVASSREKEIVDGIRRQLNYNGPTTSKKEITALLADALRITRLAMDEQALRATTAYSLIEKTSTLPSGEVVSLTADKCRERLIRGLSRLPQFYGQ